MRPGLAILTAGRLYGSSPCRCDSPAPNFRSTPLHILNPLIHTVVIAAAPISSPLSSDLCEDATPQLYTDSPAFDPSRCIASMRDGSKSRRDRSIPFAISLSVVRESAATPNALSRPSGHLQSIDHTVYRSASTHWLAVSPMGQSVRCRLWLWLWQEVCALICS